MDAQHEQTSTQRDGVVIAGGGLAAQRCAETLRRLGYGGRVRMVCAETHLPYDRPPLSKQVLLDPAAADSVGFRPPDWYETKAVELIRGVAASGLDVAAHTVELSDGRSLAYETLVIATGSRPRTIDALARYSNVRTLRTLEDARALRDLLDGGEPLLIIGAGFIGQEVAAAARSHGVEVTVIEAEPAPLHRVLGRDIGNWFAALHRAEGVELLLGASIAQIHGGERVQAVTIGDATTIETGHVLVAVGVDAQLDWVGEQGVTHGAIQTDAAGHSELPDVYAAGDAAAVYDAFLGRHVAVGHWEASGRQGTAAAYAIAGQLPPPPAISSFWTDQYAIKIQYLGHAELADDVTIEGDPAARDFVAVYTRRGLAVAALIVGRPRAVGELRERLGHLVAQPPP